MSTFTLAISYLTTSNLPWFMDLTFQVHMQYSLQNQTLFSSAGTSTAERHFHFGPVSSFFLELLVIAFRFSPVAYWTPSDLAGSSSSVIYFCLFILFISFSARMVCHFLLLWATFHQNSSLWTTCLGPAWHGSWLHWVTQAPLPQHGSDPWRHHQRLHTTIPLNYFAYIETPSR